MRSAFTLVELMVVVAIILLLVGLTVGFGAWATRSTEEGLTKASLANAQILYEEYSNTLGAAPTGWPAGVGGAGSLIFYTKNLAAFKKYYASMPSKILDFPANRINDGWGNPLQFVPANNAYVGNPSRPAPYFLSGGADGNAATPADNVYSFSLLQ